MQVEIFGRAGDGSDPNHCPSSSLSSPSAFQIPSLDRTKALLISITLVYPRGDDAAFSAKSNILF
jgi:hypothetical protein